ncbi:hypothetical protein CDAR_475251 [Caerostris darwini]|uniref:Uncharacterized protein n=1 Tax=Caerostris darwini TaxID=1538125 RepID=A0AAV4V8B0_9ARAC|nr:hypothetical protein CDAR_475251 [Caerostris darwini]
MSIIAKKMFVTEFYPNYLHPKELKFFWIHRDTKLNWIGQIKKAVDRGESRDKLLKHLAGTTWGSTQDVLCTAYKVYVRSVVEYGSEALLKITEANSKRLDIFQNRILRFITGGTIAAMEFQTGLEPLYNRRWKMALNLAEKS